MHPTCHLSILRLSLCLLLFSLFPLSHIARPFVLVLSQDELKDAQNDDASPLDSDSSWEDDEFDGTHVKPDDELDPGSWRRLFEPATTSTSDDSTLSSYYAAVEKMISASTNGDARIMEEATVEIETSANTEGDPHARSVLGFLYGIGMMRERNKAKAFLNHYFAAEGGNAQSMMALAYTYSRQEVSFSFLEILNRLLCLFLVFLKFFCF